MANLALRRIWDEAERICLGSQRIVFCGYSFPDADVHVRYMLKRAEMNRGSKLEVFVVNNHPGKSSEAAYWEKDRYLRFIIDKANVHYMDISFEDYATNTQVIEDATRWK